MARRLPEMATLSLQEKATSAQRHHHKFHGSSSYVTGFSWIFVGGVLLWIMMVLCKEISSMAATL